MEPILNSCRRTAPAFRRSRAKVGSQQNLLRNLLAGANIFGKRSFIYRQYDSSHRQIWDEFRHRGRTFNAIGRNGDLLRANRVSADYSAEIKNLDKLIEQSFELAEKVNSYLEQAEGKQTN